MLRKNLPPIIYRVLKPTFKLLQKGVYSIVDAGEYLLNLRDPLVPPRSKIFIGGGDFKRTGNDFRKLFIELGGLKPTHRVLDIGCGIGRMAGPLTAYLSNGGTYEGFDIVKDGIDWCQTNISTRYTNFKFQVADIHNDHYNPSGSYFGAEYRFPFPDNEFDFAFLTSVFTHMPTAEVERYVHEIGRVLKPGGSCLATFFLINDESRRLMTTSKSAHNIQHYAEGRYIAYPDDPEICVGFDEGYVRELFRQHGMEIKVYPGEWCGRDSFTSFQDIVLATKR